MAWHGRWRWLGTDRGSVSVEAALGLSTLVLVVMAMVAAIATMSSHLAAVDIAGAAARAYAIGQDFTPPRGDVEVHQEGELVRVTARVPAPFGVMQAQAVFPLEVVGQ
ncbi:hypothetical protein G7Y31_01075 [Corynebacterium lizhenjunii]|uniref:TadE-like protein n=2 Tax=Corynebacterium lizhenjunii TaxID=2709394 RepID=A0A7T0KGD3_9CORY|nr:hypothetical protein [Corynebacterium lizhenjunii]QPK80241.1 hypothetical protein G7Y31_01075 [Corynebacterium lizhenjunii]